MENCLSIPGPRKSLSLTSFPVSSMIMSLMGLFLVLFYAFLYFGHNQQHLKVKLSLFYRISYPTSLLATGRRYSELSESQLHFSNASNVTVVKLIYKDINLRTLKNHPPVSVLCRLTCYKTLFK